MLMPIVSMNKMAMNESVAATCCYHEKASPTNVYWEVLHGGWIGSGYVTLSTKDVFYGATQGWTSLTRDIKGWTGNKLPKLSKGLDGEWRVNVGSAYVGTGTEAWVPGSDGIDYAWELLNVWLTNNKVSLYDANCSHNDTDCVYYAEDIQHVSNYHFESKSKHNVSGSQVWTEAHSASQYTS